MLYPRIAETNINKYLDNPEIIILYGPRRAGKTTTLQKLSRQLAASFPTSFYSLDDPTASVIFRNPSTASLKKIFSELGFLRASRNFLLLDEIQSFEKIDLLFKLIYDHFPYVKVIATSSSSLLLLNDLTESLAGRKYFLEVLPLTLAEYKSLTVPDYFSFQQEFLTQKEELNHLVSSFAVYGSYPEVLNLDKSEEKIGKLKDILDSSLYKDIFIQEKIKAPKALINLVEHLSFQIGGLVNLNELATTLGISRNTVNEYISILEKFFIVFRLLPFERNLRSELTAKFKVYFWDLGVRNAVISRFTPFEGRDDKGGLFENLIIASIIKRNLYHGKPFKSYFWRTYEGFEIDLVMENVTTGQIGGFQISTQKTVKFSRAFTNRYKPRQLFKVTPPEAYKYCL